MRRAQLLIVFADSDILLSVLKGFKIASNKQLIL